MRMRKFAALGRIITALTLALCVTMCGLSLAEETMGTPPTPPDGAQFGGDTPPEGEQPFQGGTPPEGFSGEMPGEPPAGGMGGMPGGQGGQPSSYEAVKTVSENAVLTGETLSSAGTDENALLITGGNVTLDGASVSRVSDNSTGGDSASFYGVGAAILATSGALTVSNSTVTTDASGGAGVFSYGNSVVTVSDTTIDTKQDTSGGIHVAGGGTLYASNLTVTTQGDSSAAIRSDRGGGSMTVSGGSYTSNGAGSPAVYVTANIAIQDAALTANNSEALCLEGRNSVSLTNCDLSGNMPDQSQNDNTWTVILYQSMSGDAQVGEGSFRMTGGTLTSHNGGIFYTTNTESVFELNNVKIVYADDCEYFLRCTGNTNQRGWGQSGQNGANCSFTAACQEMNGLVIWDSISTLDLKLTEGSVLTGAVINDEACAGEGGSGQCSVSIDQSSSWIVTGNSALTKLQSAGTITDHNGLSVTVKDSGGNILKQGESPYIITVDSYEAI